MFSEGFAPSLAVTDASSALVGPRRELDALDAFVANVVNEHGALLLRGGVGVGKSALLLVARHRAELDGVRVLSMSGVRSEMGVAFAGLHRILRPLLHSAPGLPGPQRDALLSTFGMRDGQPQENFLIALAALELLANEAKRNPVLVTIDDASTGGDTSALARRGYGRASQHERAGRRRGTVPSGRTGLPPTAGRGAPFRGSGR